MQSIIFLLIGNVDPVVRMYWGRLSEERIKSMGFQQYIFKEYDGMAHTICNQVRNRHFFP